MKKIIKQDGVLLTFYNYKEPLKEIPKGKGFGFYGVLLASQDETQVQCHVCGKLFSSVSGHARMKHGISARDYKDKFGLAHTTSLVSEVERQRRKQQTLDWIASLTPEQKEEFRKGAKDRYLTWAKRRIENGWNQPKESLESKNKKGTCPDQLLAKIKECAKKLKKSPSKDEFIDFCGTQRYMHLIYKTFGSWAKAKQMIGYDILPSNNGGKGKPNRRYDEGELIEYLQIFYKETGKIPTETDFRRGLLPDSAAYVKRFGGISRARELAGIYDVPSKWKK